MLKIQKMLDAIFLPFSEARNEKPQDMLFVAHESPDMMTTIATASQHVLIILMLTVYVVFVGREIGFTGAQLRSFVSIEIVVVGLTTLLQSLKTRFSSGHLIIHGASSLGPRHRGIREGITHRSNHQQGRRRSSRPL